MVYIIAGLLLLWLGANLMRSFLRANPAAVARRMKQGAGVAALLAALLLLMRGRIDLAFGLAGVGLWLTYGQKAPQWSGFVRAPFARTRRVSKVRSTFIEMELDHDTGAMRGRVLGGPYGGRELDSLGQSELAVLHAARSADDPEGARLLEAYLDRRFAGWREAMQGEGDARGAGRTSQGRSRAGGMSEDEAYELLGLAKGAGREEIARAHRALMKRYHPDYGGSTAMAARVNEAKDVLLRRHP